MQVFTDWEHYAPADVGNKVLRDSGITKMQRALNQKNQIANGVMYLQQALQALGQQAQGILNMFHLQHQWITASRPGATIGEINKYAYEQSMIFARNVITEWWAAFPGIHDVLKITAMAIGLEYYEPQVFAHPEQTSFAHFQMPYNNNFGGVGPQMGGGVPPPPQAAAPRRRSRKRGGY